MRRLGFCTTCAAAFTQLLATAAPAPLAQGAPAPARLAPAEPLTAGEVAAASTAASRIETDHVPRLGPGGDGHGAKPGAQEPRRRVRPIRKAARAEARAEAEARQLADRLRALQALPAIRGPVELACGASAEFGQRPEPGLQAPPFFWGDLPDGQRPPRRSAGEGGYAVYHAIEVDADLRITYQTVVSTRAGKPGTAGAGHLQVQVDSRTSVQKRALLDLMDGVRRGADHRARRAREAQARRLARHRAEVLRWPRGFRRLGFGLVRAEARTGTAMINVRRNAMRSMVEVPDKLMTAALRVDAQLSTSLGRRSLWDGIKSPSALTGEQRSVVLTLTLFLVLAGVLVLNSFFALVLPEWAGAYRLVLLDAGTQFAGVFGFPLPIELPLIQQAVGGMAALAFAGFFAGKLLGVWVLYLLGDTLHAKLEHHTKGKGAQRVVGWLRRNANKYGFPILFIDNAVPLMPDQVLLVFAVSGIRFRSWIWGIGLGTALKFGVIVAGVYLVGPAKVEHIFNPFG